MTTSTEMPAPDSVEAEGQKSRALDSLEVEGYKSIRSAKIDLGPINVLIGANGSGKSNLVGLFGLLADLADRRLQLHIARQGGADAILHFGRKTTSRLQISLRFGFHDYQAVLVPAAGDTLVFENEAAGVKLSPQEKANDLLPGLNEIWSEYPRSGEKETRKPLAGVGWQPGSARPRPGS